jgi:hypothetical protein
VNYSELRQRILDMSSDNNDATFVTNVDVFIKNAERRIYQAVRIPVLRKNATSTLNPGAKYVTLPPDFLAPWEFATTAPLYSYLLLKDVSFIREAYPDPNETGVPKYYAQFDEDTLIIGPSANAAIPVELHYYYYPESIVTTATTWLGDNYPNLLLYACMVEAAAFMKSEEDVVKQYAEGYAVNMKLLQTYAAGKNRSGDYR